MEHWESHYGSSRSKMLFKIGALKNSLIFTGKNTSKIALNITKLNFYKPSVSLLIQNTFLTQNCLISLRKMSSYVKNQREL